MLGFSQQTAHTWHLYVYFIKKKFLSRPKAGTPSPRQELNSRRRLHLFYAPTRKGCLGGREGGRFCAPRIRRKQPARPLTGQPAQHTRELSPRSRPLTVLAWRLPKNAPCISISLPFLYWHVLPGPPQLSSAALSVLVLFISAPCLPKAERKTLCQEGAVAVGASSVPCPAVPSQPSPASRTLDYGSECHSHLGLRVCSPGPWVRVALWGSCALLAP